MKKQNDHAKEVKMLLAGVYIGVAISFLLALVSKLLGLIVYLSFLGYLIYYLLELSRLSDLLSSHWQEKT